MKTPRSIPLILLATTGAAVLAYNLWSYCCGRCRLEHFFTLGPPGVILLLALGAAGTTLLVLKRLRYRREGRAACRCGTDLSAEWLYCPSCGSRAVVSR